MFYMCLRFVEITSVSDGKYNTTYFYCLKPFQKVESAKRKLSSYSYSNKSYMKIYNQAINDSTVVFIEIESKVSSVMVCHGCWMDTTIF